MKVISSERDLEKLKLYFLGFYLYRKLEKIKIVSFLLSFFGVLAFPECLIKLITPEDPLVQSLPSWVAWIFIILGAQFPILFPKSAHNFMKS